MSRLQLPAPSLANARSHGLDCPSYGFVGTRMDLLLVWTRLRDGLPVHMVVVAPRRQAPKRSLANDKRRVRWVTRHSWAKVADGG